MGAVAALASTLVAVAVVVASSVGADVSPQVAAPRPRAVVLVMVERMDWASAPAVLHGSAHAALSLHSAGSALHAVDGFLTLGTGRRATGDGTMAELTRAAGVAPTFTIPGWKQIVADDAKSHYGGRLGAFGTALERSGRRWRFITEDAAASLAVADEHGVVRHASWGGADEVRAALAAGTQIVVTNASSPSEVPPLVAAAGHRCTVVASVSSPGRYTHLGVLAVSPACGLGVGGLVSSSTRQQPFVTLVDVAPTVLDRAGLRRPATMVGQPARPSRPVSTAHLVAEDVRAHRTLSAHDSFAWYFIAVSSIAAAAMCLRARRLPLVMMASMAALPVSSFAMMAVPWWSGGAWAADVACTLIALALGSAAWWVWRERPAICFAAIAAVTVAVLVGDAVRGGTLELDAPFGNSPTIAGRFDGIGNIAFGFSMGATLVLCAIALHRWRRRALPWVIAICAAFAISGAPSLGDKVGLVPVWVPAAGVLLLSAGSVRIRLRWIVAFGGAALVVLGAFAAYDLTRSAGSQSHLARFLSSGDTLDTISRKATSMLRSFRDEPLRFLIPLPLLALFGERHAILRTHWLRSLVLALATAAVLGSLLEDSGVAVGVAVLAASWPAIGWLASAEPSPSAPPPEPDPDLLDAQRSAGTSTSSASRGVPSGAGAA